tara:strand:+ start:3963 stop:5582 length:1620 start_codon:yes stop_codon:yes gene_type:complete
LSIVDVKNAQQPMVSLNGRYVIIYNGEIVNFKDLQKNYLPNVKLKTKSDTEVLIELYSKFGSVMLKYIKGMYAFAIYDKLTKKFFLARDHIGIKPLYYFKKNDLFAFSSEIKAFYTTNIKNFEIEKENINEFLVHGTIFGKKTLHKNVNELKPGHYLVGSSKSIKIFKYWDVSEVRKNEKKNLHDTIRLIQTNFEKIIEEWCISDVKIGSLLSGGIDSTYISTIASKYKKVDMFTNYFPDRKNQFSEVSLASIVARSTQNKHYKVKVKDDFSNTNIEKLVTHLSDPIQDLNSLSFMALCKYIKSTTNTKVILSGEGADELYAGYDRHYKIARNYEKTKNFDDILFSMNYLSSNRLKFFFDTNYNLTKERKKIKKDLDKKNFDALKKVLLHDQKTFLPGYLDRVDKISMMYGLEMRTPFLDERLISIANMCDSKFKTKKINGNIFRKFILRKIFQKNVSKKIVWNKNKYQFTFPDSESFKNGALNILYRDLINKNSEITKYFKFEKLLGLINHHEKGFADHSNLLGRLLTFELFSKLKFR